MHALSVVALFLAGSLEVRDGTIVVLENSNFVVETYTRSEVTHVGMVLNSQGEPFVYEATPRVVRKLKLGDYYEELGVFNRGRRTSNQLRVRLYQPATPYSEPQLARMRAFFDEQLGRRYSVRGIVRHKQGDGIHCAELVSTALTRSGRYDFEKTYSISPARLVRTIEPTHEPPIDVPLPCPEPTGTWCERSWSWWAGMFTWCGWACYETWTFCQ